MKKSRQAILLWFEIGLAILISITILIILRIIKLI